MRVVDLGGGIGNVLFMYAFGQRIAYETKEEVVYNKAWFNEKQKYSRELLLDAFNVNFKLSHNLFSKKIIEQNFEFDADFLSDCVKSDDYGVFGYYQSEKYFEPLKKQIKKIKIKKERLTYNTFINDVKNTNSVSLHIRRGDYLEFKHVFHILDANYYISALEKIDILNIEEPNIFIFCDVLDLGLVDLIRQIKEWLPERIQRKMKLVKGYNELDDFNLMSNCKYHINANSSFSWWAAYTSKSKQVVIPKNWFCNHLNSKDILPNDSKWSEL